MYMTGLALNVVNKHIYVCRLSSDAALSVNNSHNRFRDVRNFSRNFRKSEQNFSVMSHLQFSRAILSRECATKSRDKVACAEPVEQQQFETAGVKGVKDKFS